MSVHGKLLARRGNANLTSVSLLTTTCITNKREGFTEQFYMLTFLRSLLRHLMVHHAVAHFDAMIG